MSLRACALRAIAKNPSLSFASISEQSLVSLSSSLKLDIIKSLSISAGWVDDVLPLSFFAGLPLRAISFSACSTLSAAYILAVARAVPTLRGLDLTSCFYVGDADVVELLRTLPHLRYLCLCDCRRLTTLTTDALVRFGGSLRHVDIGGCGSLSRADVCTFLARHPAAADFRGLGLSGTEGLDDEAMRIIGARFRRLARLSAGYYRGTEATLIAALVANQASLVSLDLHWPRALSDDVALALTTVDRFGELRFLNVQGVKGVSLDGLCAILNVHPRPAGLTTTPSWDAIEWLEWCTAVADTAAAPTTTFVDTLGPGIASISCRFSGAEANGLIGVRAHISSQAMAVKTE